MGVRPGSVQNPGASCPRRPPRPRQRLRGSRPGAASSTRASARCRSASTAAKGARHLRASLYDRLGPLPPVARGHGGKPTPHAVATFASSIKIFGQRSTPCRGAAAAATKRRRNR